MALDIAEYVKKAIEKHPKLTLIEQCESHSCQHGHVFLVAAIGNHANTAALSTSDLEEKVNDEAGVKNLIATRLQMIEDVLVKKEA